MSLSLAGLVISGYLAYSHYRVYTDISYQSFCALTKSLNCDTVSQSPYALFWSIPVAVWGIWGYTFFIALLGLAMLGGSQNFRLWSLLFITAVVFSLGGLVLAGISTFIIHSYCLMCIATYGINFSLAYTAWIIIARFRDGRLGMMFQTDVLFLRRNKKPAIIFFILALLIPVAIHQLIPAYWRIGSPASTVALPTGVTAEGDPWIGAENPTLVITAFSDYQCFQCRKMHFYLRRLITQNSTKIRLVHRHYPMDQEFNPIVKTLMHVGSGKLALIATKMIGSGKFWQVNDALFALAARGKSIGLKDLSAMTGVPVAEFQKALRDADIRTRLRRDILDGLKLKISGTPSFVIEGRVFPGHIPPEVITRTLSP